MIYIYNEAKPLHAAIAYLKAAEQTEYMMMFTSDGTKMEDMKIQSAKTAYLQDASKFNKDHGLYWYFCKCKENAKCKIMWKNKYPNGILRLLK